RVADLAMREDGVLDDGIADSVDLIVCSKAKVIVLSRSRAADPFTLLAIERRFFAVSGHDVLAKLGAYFDQEIAKMTDQREVPQDIVLGNPSVIDRDTQDQREKTEDDGHAKPRHSTPDGFSAALGSGLRVSRNSRFLGTELARINRMKSGQGSERRVSRPSRGLRARRSQSLPRGTVSSPRIARPVEASGRPIHRARRKQEPR